MSQQDLSGKRVLVTGGARGFGAAVAQAAAEAGASVMVSDVLDELGQQTAESIGTKTGATVAFTHLDITDDASWEAAAAATVEQLGGWDVLVNNAGVEVTSLVIDTDPDQLRTMLDVNVLGTTLGIKHAFRAMRPEGAAGAGGSVVNISSVAAMESGKLGYGVRVNCVYPGLVPTEMGVKLAVETTALGLFESTDAAIGAVVELTPLGRLGTVEDIADVVVFLASDASRFITGAGVPVDGGMGM